MSPTAPLLLAVALFLTLTLTLCTDSTVALSLPATTRTLPPTMETGEFETFNDMVDPGVCGGGSCKVRTEMDPRVASGPGERCCSSLVGPGLEAGACIPGDHVCCGCSAKVCCACPRNPSNPHAPPKCASSCAIDPDDPSSSCAGCCPAFSSGVLGPFSSLSSLSPPSVLLAVAVLVCLGAALYKSFVVASPVPALAAAQAKDLA